MANAYKKMTLQQHKEAGANQPDHWMNIAHLPYFIYATRAETEEKLKDTSCEYILRNCNDPSEFINGIPNPNLFVLSYKEKGAFPGESAVFRHIKMLRVPEKGVAFTNKETPFTKFFPSVQELISNSSVYYVKPLTIA